MKLHRKRKTFPIAQNEKDGENEPKTAVVRVMPIIGPLDALPYNGTSSLRMSHAFTFLAAFHHQWRAAA